MFLPFVWCGTCGNANGLSLNVEWREVASGTGAHVRTTWDGGNPPAHTVNALSDLPAPFSLSGARPPSVSLFTGSASFKRTKINLRKGTQFFSLARSHHVVKSGPHMPAPSRSGFCGLSLDGPWVADTVLNAGDRREEHLEWSPLASLRSSRPRVN